MKISFILFGEKHYSPEVKPFIMIAKGLTDLGLDVLISDAGMGHDARQYVEGIFPDIEKFDFTDKSYFRDCDYVICDDSVKGLHYVDRVKKKFNLKTVCYSQIFYGTKALRPNTSELYHNKIEELKFRFARFLPFQLISREYVSMMKRADIIISNSIFTEMFLYSAYGILSNGVIYPPADTMTFHISEEERRSEKVLVFLGSPQDTNPRIYFEYLHEFIKNGIEVAAFGDRRMANVISSEFRSKVQYYRDISDIELAKLYRSVMYTFLPPTWEAFGNVGPESLLCGTPVLIRLYQPWMEIVGENVMIRRVKSP